jgi:GNAT superfamily N-acetyltransferase
MIVVTAELSDVPGWLDLAAEVEGLFGPLVGELGFLRSLVKNIGRGSAFCIRESDRPAGAPLLGGIMLSDRAPLYTIRWLAVSERQRRRGVGRLLVQHVVNLASLPGEIVVVTFGGDVRDGLPARLFYERLGFTPAENAPDGPEGRSRQVFRRRIETT